MPADTNLPHHNLHTALNLRELLALPHETFLPTAFTALLGREPDVVGLIHYALCLQGGARRVLILAEIRTSPEGRRHAPYATSDELESLVRRYQRIRGLPLGRWRWNLLPQFGREPPSDNFDWERWATVYAGQNVRALAPQEPEPFIQQAVHPIAPSEQKFIALEQRVEALSAALQQALSLMQEHGISTSQSVPVSWKPDTPPKGYSAISAGEVSWAARIVYAQLLQTMNNAR